MVREKDTSIRNLPDRLAYGPSAFLAVWWLFAAIASGLGDPVSKVCTGEPGG